MIDLRCRLSRTAVIVLLLASTSAAQERSPGQRQPPQPPAAAENPEQPLVGIYLTPHTLDFLLDKAARRLARDYGFDEFQQEQMRQLLHERVPAFLNAHRVELQRLVNDFLDVQASETPPDPEVAAEWAERAAPLFDEFKGMVGGLANDMREFMTDDQQVLLDGYLAAFETGAQFVSNRLETFRAGGFDPEIHWPRSKSFRKIDRQEMQALRQQMEESRWSAMSAGGPAAPLPAARAGTSAGAALAADEQPAAAVGAAGAGQTSPGGKQPAGDKDEWTRYVESFIRHYKLNDEQQQKARMYLQHQQKRREAYELGKAAEMERVRKMFAESKSDARKLELAEAAYRKLREPIDTMFEQLKQKLETLPTRQQRRDAAGTAPPDASPSGRSQAAEKRP